MIRLMLAAGAAVVGGAVARYMVQDPSLKAAPTTSFVPLALPDGVVVQEVPGTMPGPLLFVLHGANNDERQLIPYLARIKTHKFFVRGFLPAGEGYQWLKSRIRTTPEATFSRELEATASRIAALIRTIKAQRGARAAAVAGFSQGGHLAWFLAAHGAVDGAAVASGALAPSQVVERPPGRVLVRYVSGAEDKTVPWSMVARTAQTLKNAGFDVRGWEVKTGHSLGRVGPELARAAEEVVVRLTES